MHGMKQSANDLVSKEKIEETCGDIPDMTTMWFGNM